MAARLIALLLYSLPALAQAETALADRLLRQERVMALQFEAKVRQQEADAVLKSREQTCVDKFFSNACREEARSEHLTAIREVRRLESEGAALERAVREDEAAEVDGVREEQARQKAADLAGRQAVTAAERQAAEAATAAHLADKERKAEAGARRKEAEAEKQRRKEAAHAAKVARKKQQAAEK